MGRIADHVMRMFADGARSAEIVAWIAKAEEKEQAKEIDLANIHQAFNAFWEAFPNRKGKPDAFKAFAGALKRFPLERIMLGVERYVQTRRPDQPWLNPATFLRQERFNDEPAPVAQRQTSVDAARQKLRQEIEDEQHRPHRQEDHHRQPVRRLPRLDL